MTMRSLILGMIIIGSSELVLTGVIGPKLVRDGYAGQSLWTVNNYFAATHRRSKPIEFYLDRLDVVTRNSAIVLVSAIAIAFAVRSEIRSDWFWSRKIIGEATAESLGMIRMIVCTLTFFYTLPWDMPSVALLPRDLMSPSGGVIGLFRLLPGFVAMENSRTGLDTMKAIMLIAMALGAIGLWTRVALPVAVVLYTIFSGLLRVPTFYFHEGLVSLYLMAMLCVTPCADGLSIDRLRRIRRGGAESLPPSPSLNYGWARFGCWMTMALVYFSAGTSKIRNGGLLWWDPVNLKTEIFRSGLDHMPTQFDFFTFLNQLPLGVFAVLGLISTSVEIAMILTPFSRRARQIFPIMAAGLHIGIVLCQNIFFLDLILLQSIYMEPERLLPWLRRRPGDPSVAAPALSSAGGTESNTQGRSHVQPAMVMCILTAFAIVFNIMANQVEFYPISCFQMFSGIPNRESTRAQYYKLLAHLDNGTTVRAEPEKQIGAMWGTMYRQYFIDVWDLARGPHRLDEFLKVCGKMYNTSKPNEPHIVKYELQLLEWDWRADPENPKHGEVVRVHWTPIDP